MNHKDIKLSQISQSKKDKFSIIPLTLGFCSVKISGAGKGAMGVRL